MKEAEKVISSEITTRVVTVDDLLTIYSISLDNWEIEKQIVNTWEVGAKGPDNKIVTTPLFQVKVWLKNKQTAVQWLQDKLFELEIKIDSKTHEETFFLFQQAKQMEKEQIKDAYKNGALTEFLKISELKDSEQYYNETYVN